MTHFPVLLCTSPLSQARHSTKLDVANTEPQIEICHFLRLVYSFLVTYCKLLTSLRTTHPRNKPNGSRRVEYTCYRSVQRPSHHRLGICQTAPWQISYYPMTFPLTESESAIQCILDDPDHLAHTVESCQPVAQRMAVRTLQEAQLHRLTKGHFLSKPFVDVLDNPVSRC